MIGGPAEGFVGNPGPAVVGANPAAAGVGPPRAVLHDHDRPPDVAVIRRFKPRAVGRERVVKHSVIADRGFLPGVIVEGDRLASGEFAVALAEQFVAAPGAGPPVASSAACRVFERVFAGGERLLALAELFRLGFGGLALLLFEFRAGLLDFHAFALDRVALGGESLVLDLLFELLLALEGLIRLAFQFGESFARLGSGFVAAGETNAAMAAKGRKRMGFMK